VKKAIAIVILVLFAGVLSGCGHHGGYSGHYSSSNQTDQA